MCILYTPISFRKVTLPNRWVLSPMCMYSAKEGMPSPFHLVHYGSRAQGGVGLVVLEATAISPEGRITPQCLGIWTEEQAGKLKEIVDFIHQNTASKVGIQLAHAGRKASTENGKQLDMKAGWETIAPSDIGYLPTDRTPKELSNSEIQDLVISFREAARRAVHAGFDVIELHAAHGYLIHQFLSPLSNVRTDEYGGSFENRIRFLLEIIEAVQLELNENTALFVRISATEYYENGWDVSDSVALSKLLKAAGVDLVDVSSGGNIHGAKISVFDGYQVPFSEEIRKNTGIKTGAVGLILNTEQAEQILENEQADLVFLGRELLRNPYLPTIEAIKNGEDCFFSPQYFRGKPTK